ncbi:uncharacterized protein LOC107045381 [Diachasma alloeum]|uniref:uncharacterized protein LOC107045381 n=1 Tax=Diachasma alloeum TaxID=454923 RepID=UPI0007384E4A|nr:uncharacterized protein LOC107045381 [Diachasma alloeum]
MALALISPDAPSPSLVRCRFEGDEVLQPTFLEDLRAIVRRVIRQIDRGYPVLWIMENGENEKVKNKNISGEQLAIRPPTKERRKDFFSSKAEANLTSWASAGIAEYRRPL